MRILHVNKFFDLKGGVEHYLHGAIERQRARGHEIAVLSTRGPSDLPAPGPASFVARNELRTRGGLVRDAKVAADFVWNREAKREMEGMIARFRPDVVHLHNVYHHLSTSILAPIRKAGVPCVQTLHDLKLACPNYLMFTEGAPCERCKGGKYYEAVRHRCLAADLLPNILAAAEMGFTKFTQSYERTVSAFICPSQFFADKLAAWGEPPSKMRVLPNPGTVASEPAPLDGDYVLFAARLSIEKGAEMLVKAAALAPEAKVKFAGIGPREAAARSLAESLGAKNVEFLGFVHPSALGPMKRHAKALLSPSVWYENSPLTVLEAMGEGVPIAASRIGGLPELVDDGKTGWLAPPNDVEAWGKLLRDIWATPTSRLQEMGAANRERLAERHDWGKHLDALERFYSEAGEPGPRA